MKLSWQWTITFAAGFRMFTHAILAERAACDACWMVPLRREMLPPVGRTYRCGTFMAARGSRKKPKEAAR